MIKPSFKLIRNHTLAAALFAAAIPALAHEFKAGDLMIEHPWSRVTPKGSPVAAGYLVIHNNGAAADRLLGAESDIARQIQVHEMAIDNGVMKMRELPKGQEIPPGGVIELKPGGNHLMMMNPARPFVEGEMLKAVLIFERAGKVPVEFKVESMGYQPKGGAMDHNAMDHGEMHKGH